MNVGVDLDGTIDSFPRVFQSLMTALVHAGHHVYVITGVSDPQVTPEDIAAKKSYLTSLGIGPADYTQLIVCPSPHPKHKAKAVETNKIDLMIDNKKGTAKKVDPEAAVLILWNSKEK